MLHSQNAFEDIDDPAIARQLLRLRLRENDRSMAPGVPLRKGRGGIVKRDGKGTDLTGKHAKPEGISKT